LKLKSLLRFKRRKPSAASDSSSRLAKSFILFDQDWYLSRNPDVAASGVDPLQHYLAYGAKEGRDPHPLFDTAWYLNQEPRLRNIETTALEHYIVRGSHEGRTPHPQFDAQFYTEKYLDSYTGERTPLEHYLTIGWTNGHRPNPAFDPHFYLRTYPDVAAAKMEPLTHYVRYGQKEGRKRSVAELSFQTHRPALTIPRRSLISLDRSATQKLKLIAFYLPQFHPIPENDLWWGSGFTDWKNVRGGQPYFTGHYQPHIPAAFGWYDLRNSDVLPQQADLAKRCGIFGFCFHYYWFGGKVLLDLPLRQMMESGQPDFPFCISWANENWTRRWDGCENDILIAQEHSPKDDLDFIKRIERVLLQNNYIRIDGKPLLLVYRPSLFPNALDTTNRWRGYFRDRGHGELHLTMVRSFHDQTAPAVYGFDAAAQFPPHLPAVPITTSIPGKLDAFAGDIYDYSELRKGALEQFGAQSTAGKTYAGVMPSWDNTARRGPRASIWANSSPEAYYEWLSAAVEGVRTAGDPEEQLVFINAWNEWAEGCHLEPDEKYGNAWLNATALALVTPPDKRSDARTQLSTFSTGFSSENSSSTNADSVLVLTPIDSQIIQSSMERAKQLAYQATAGLRRARVIYDNSGQAPIRGLPHPHRQFAMASIRQEMIEHHLRDEQWVFWVDVDIVDYSAGLIEELIQRAKGGVAAPLVLMQGDINEPVGNDGFGPGRFYDIAGFVENGRWARFTPPYFDQNGPAFHLNSVGSCYLVNADLYRIGAKHTIDPASAKFIDSNQSWPPDAVAKNQEGAAIAYTEHYSVCQFAIQHGRPVQAFADLIAYHTRV
jgi:hypothetical protein